MQPKWIIFLTSSFVIFTIINVIIEQQSSVDPVMVERLTSLMTVQFPSDINPINFVVAIFQVAVTWFTTFWSMLIWDYAHLNIGLALWAKYIIFWPISIGIVGSVVLNRLGGR